MGWWPFTKRVKSAARAMVKVIRAKFDSAQTTPDNMKHWAQADFLSANAAARPEIRRILRNRSRYEVANNSYARGIVLTLANDCIGTGPRLQMLLGGGEDAGANGIIEREFAAWAKIVNLASKLRTMRMARAQDGEAFGLLFTNPSLTTPVQLDIKLLEADQVTTPLMKLPTPTSVDGIILDEFGNPTAYHVLDSHPGELASNLSQNYRTLPEAFVIHWFRIDRPGQARGIPDILPALPLFAQLRRYTLAVIAAAESAANIAIFMKTTAPPGGEAAEVEPMTEMEFTPNMAVFGPEGWEPAQIKAEQPATTYDLFKHEILNEIARCLNMPYNIAACNSSGYNYASGRLDHQTYYKSIRVDQAHCESVVLDRLLDAWMTEAVKAYPELSGLTDWPHQWFWDGHEHVDPAKEASAQQTRLASNTTTLAAEFARQGKDWETELRQRAKEVALMKELGLSLPNAETPNSQNAKTGTDSSDQKPAGDEEDEAEGEAPCRPSKRNLKTAA